MKWLHLDSPKVFCCTNCHPTPTFCLPLCPCYVSLDALWWFALLCRQAYASWKPCEFTVLLFFLPKHWVLINVWVKLRYDSPCFLSLQFMDVGERANQWNLFFILFTGISQKLEVVLRPSGLTDPLNYLLPPLCFSHGSTHLEFHCALLRLPQHLYST